MGSSSSPEDCRELESGPFNSRLCARLVEKTDQDLREGQGPGHGPIVTRTASGSTLEFWQAVLVGDVATVSHLLASPDAGLTPDVVFDTSDPERWRDYRFNIRALRLWSLTYVEELTTPIHVAASRGHEQVLQLLLSRGAQPDAAPGGRTALHEACIASHAPCARLLLVAGADPDLPDQDGRRPLHLCQGPSALQCAELLLRFGARVDGRSEEEEETPLHVAARGGLVELAALLLRKGACPDARDAQGRSPLLAACSVPFLPPAEAEAATSRCLHLCQLLLSAGADADATDHDRQRPLHLACRRGNVAVTELLLSRGVSVNAMDYGGHTALHWALQGPAAALPCSPEQVVRALLNHGAVRIWPGALSKVLERWCEFPRIIEVLMNTYSIVKLPGDAVDLIPPEVLQKHRDFYSSLFTLVGRPRSLKHLSRHALRSHLASCLSQALPQLPLPPCLLRYLQLDFEDVLY
ncbi:ankyrin repeat and SOCS box protein 10 isoform X2 [Macrotis lagotis]|uniref:ankyrin repeat and SOCS box protein 10 isoform X2 n=1 Tax=Macrotis lagotis TaxID=92651 RepID=UPI003D69AE99